MSPSSSTFLLFTQQQHTVARLGTWFLTVCVSSNAHKSKHNERTRSLPKKSHISWTGHEHVFNISARKHDKLRFNQLWKCTLSFAFAPSSSHLRPHTQETNNFPIKTFLLSLQRIKLQIESNNIVFWKQQSEIRPAVVWVEKFSSFSPKASGINFLSSSSFGIFLSNWRTMSMERKKFSLRKTLARTYGNLLEISSHFEREREVEIKTEEFQGWV